MDTTKNFGPLVSGYLPTDQRAWETTVFQAGKPVLDKELNLAQDLDIGAAQSANRASMPSGWLMADCLRLADPTSAIFTSEITANALRIPDLLAHVNGWVIPVTHTNSNTGAGQNVNQLDLGAGPVGAGTRRTDLVILEVWRKLIACAPSTDGKSPTARIWLNGNVKLGVTNDAALDLVDDLFDSNVGSETTKRVQIQYRLRVIPNVDLFTYPRGLDDPSIIANSVPANALAPEGVATIYGYALSADDPGLWVAGDGVPANDLHTVDGWMYAIPLLAVFRRNSTAFDKDTNNNGGVAFPGPSDRPDGFFADIVESRDVADLRAAVNPTGWDYVEVLEKNVNLLLDNNLRSEWVTTAPQGGGNDGHTVFYADEINVDTPGAQLIGDSDRVARTFSDRSTYEVVVAVVQPPVGGWVDGATFTINPTSMEIFPFAAGFNWGAHAPADAMWMDIVAARWVRPYAGGPPTTGSYDAKSRLTLVENLGEMPVTTLNFTLDATVTALGLTTEPMYVEILVAYPAGRGLTKTPTNDWATSLTLNNPALPALLAPPANFSSLASTNGFDYPHREVRVQYETVPVGISVWAPFDSGGRSYRLPERAKFVVSFSNNGTAYAVTLDSTGRIVTMANPADPDILPNDYLDITYVALRPMPQVGETMTFFYEARAPQAVRSSLLISDLQVIPRYISNKMYVITAGSGSQGEGYPFPYAYNQMGGIYPSSSSSFNGEHELAALVDIAVANFSARTGMLQLPVFIGYVPNPEAVTFDGPAAADIEDRSYFNQIITPDYIPNAYAQDLSDPKRHKVILPMLAELTSSSALGGKGQLVLVLLIRWAIFDETNGVWFDPALTANTTTACVFRTRGNLFNRSTF